MVWTPSGQWNTTWTEFTQPNVTGFYEMMEYANTVTAGYFGAGIVVSLFVILYISMRRWGDDSAFAAASFISMTLTGILRATEQVSDTFFMLFALMCGISVIILWMNRSK